MRPHWFAEQTIVVTLFKTTKYNNFQQKQPKLVNSNKTKGNLQYSSCLQVTYV